MRLRSLPTPLRGELALLAALHLLIVGASAFVWQPGADRPALAAVAVAAALGALHLTLVVRFVLGSAAEPPALGSRFGAANWLTFMRGLLNTLLASAVPLAAVVAAGWTAAILYTLSALIDISDGAVARLTGRHSAFGALLDMAFDAIGLLTVVVLAIAMGDLPLWFILVGLARYLFVGLLVLTKPAGAVLHPLPPAGSRRVAASTMMAFISVVLWPTVGRPETLLAAALFGGFHLTGFVRDYLIVSGTIDSNARTWRQVEQFYRRVVTAWLPPLLRLAVLFLLLTERALLTGSAAVALVGGLGALLLLPGIVGRLGGILLLVPAVFSSGAEPVRLLLLGCALGVLLLGSGRLALWQPEERLFADRNR